MSWYCSLIKVSIGSCLDNFLLRKDLDGMNLRFAMGIGGV